VDEIEKPSGDEQKTTHEKQAADDILSAGALAKLPKEIVFGLQQAVEALDVTATLNCIDQLQHQNAPLADALRKLVKEYRFDLLQKRLNNVGQ
jgi:hypothetical protein